MQSLAGHVVLELLLLTWPLHELSPQGSQTSSTVAYESKYSKTKDRNVAHSLKDVDRAGRPSFLP